MLTQQEIDAFNQVKSSVTALRNEYDAVCQNIVLAEKRLADLPLLPVPIGDMKAAILDFIDARGKSYLDEFVKPAIKNFATHYLCGLETPAGKLGEPLSFKILESAKSSASGSIGQAQLVTPDGQDRFNDIALYAFFGPQIKAVLTAVMDTMEDVDFGYTKINSAQIGTDRAARRVAIQETQDQLAALLAKKTAIADSLRQLGVIVER